MIDKLDRFDKVVTRPWKPIPTRANTELRNAGGRDRCGRTGTDAGSEFPTESELPLGKQARYLCRRADWAQAVESLLCLGCFAFAAAWRPQLRQWNHA